jgi:hypothetical protein
MDTVVAAVNCRPYVDKAQSLTESHPEYGRDHLHHMINEIESGRVAGEKSHRWLGYLQGVLVSSGAATLEQMKQTNLNA